MKIHTLDGKIETWNLTGYQISPSNDRSARSALHLQARKLIHELFPSHIILEEVPISVKKGKTLFLDFFIPLRKLALEINGKQHSSYTPHYHHTVADFKKAQQNDILKADWCELNGIDLVYFNYDESVEEWKNKFE